MKSYLKELLIFLSIFTWGGLLRLPFFFPAVIDWDESTFIIMGQSILDGELPYVTLWDLKPPLNFLFFAAAIAIFGKTVVAVRFAGLIWLAIAAYLTYRIGRRLSGKTHVGIAAAVVVMAGISLLPSGQAIMSEHVALVPLLASFAILVARPNTLVICALSGSLIAIASMIRLNLAYTAVFIGLYIIFFPSVLPINNTIRRIVSYSVGGLSIIAITALPYIYSGQTELWWQSVFIAPLKYTNSINVLFQIPIHLSNAFGLYWRFPIETSEFSLTAMILGILLWGGGGAGIVMIVKRWASFDTISHQRFILMALYIIGTTLSIITSGHFAPHYLIQIVPYFGLLSAYAVMTSRSKKNYSTVIFAAAVTVISISIIRVVPEYRTLAINLIQSKNTSYGTAYKISEYLKLNNREKKLVYLMTDHIAYWFLDLRPPSKATTHPSNIIAKFIDQTSEDPASELRRAFAEHPEFIVVKVPVSYLRNSPEVKRLLHQELSDKFDLVSKIENRNIYRRKE